MVCVRVNVLGNQGDDEAASAGFACMVSDRGKSAAEKDYEVKYLNMYYYLPLTGEVGRERIPGSDSRRRWLQETRLVEEKVVWGDSPPSLLPVTACTVPS